MCRVTHQDNPAVHPIVRGYLFDGAEMDRALRGRPNQVNGRPVEIAEQVFETTRVPMGRVRAIVARQVEIASHTQASQPAADNKDPLCSHRRAKARAG